MRINYEPNRKFEANQSLRETYSKKKNITFNSHTNISEDQVSISAKAKELFLKSTASLEMKNQDSQGTSNLSIFEIMEEIRNQMSKDGDDPFSNLYKCLIIAMRIMKGDIVPMKDEAFLAKEQPEMYLRAVLLRKQKDDPKEYESLFKEQKENNPFDSLSHSEDIDLKEIFDKKLSE